MIAKKEKYDAVSSSSLLSPETISRRRGGLAWNIFPDPPCLRTGIDSVMSSYQVPSDASCSNAVCTDLVQKSTCLFFTLLFFCRASCSAYRTVSILSSSAELVLLLFLYSSSFCASSWRVSCFFATLRTCPVSGRVTLVSFWSHRTFIEIKIDMIMTVFDFACPSSRASREGFWLLVLALFLSFLVGSYSLPLSSRRKNVKHGTWRKKSSI